MRALCEYDVEAARHVHMDHPGRSFAARSPQPAALMIMSPPTPAHRAMAVTIPASSYARI